MKIYLISFLLLVLSLKLTLGSDTSQQEDCFPLGLSINEFYLRANLNTDLLLRSIWNISFLEQDKIENIDLKNEIDGIYNTYSFLVKNIGNSWFGTIISCEYASKYIKEYIEYIAEESYQSLLYKILSLKCFFSIKKQEKRRK